MAVKLIYASALRNLSLGGEGADLRGTRAMSRDVREPPPAVVGILLVFLLKIWIQHFVQVSLDRCFLVPGTFEVVAEAPRTTNPRDFGIVSLRAPYGRDVWTTGWKLWCKLYLIRSVVRAAGCSNT